MRFFGYMGYPLDGMVDGVSVYVPNTVKVPASISLTIGPNTAILFEDEVGLEVKGVLSVQGEAGAPGQFTSNKEGGSKSVGDWKGISIVSTPYMKSVSG